MEGESRAEREARFIEDTRISFETADADSAYMRSMALTSRAEDLLSAAERSWKDARRRWLEASRDIKREDSEDARLRYRERDESARAAYGAVLLARRMRDAARALEPAAERAYFHARDCAEKDAARAREKRAA